MVMFLLASALFSPVVIGSSVPDNEPVAFNFCIVESICIKTCNMGRITDNVIDKVVTCAAGKVPPCVTCSPPPFHLP